MMFKGRIINLSLSRRSWNDIRNSEFSLDRDTHVILLGLNLLNVKLNVLYIHLNGRALSFYSNKIFFVRRRIVLEFNTLVMLSSRRGARGKIFTPILF